MMFTNPYIEPEQNIKKDGYLGSFITYKSIGSISLKALQIYKNKYPQLLLISIISFIPSLMLSMFYPEELSSITSYFLYSEATTEVFPDLTFNVYLLLILQVLLIPLVDAAMIIALGRIIISQDTNILTTFYLTLTRGYSLILNVVIFYLILILFVFLSLFVIGLPLLFLWIISTITYLHAIYFENSGVGSALFRSLKLLSKSWLDLFKFWVPILGLTALQFISSLFIYEGSLATIFNELLSFVLRPLTLIIYSLAYIHYRIKFEDLSYINYGNSVVNLGLSIEE